jgi:hypothetical protein
MKPAAARLRIAVRKLSPSGAHDSRSHELILAVIVSCITYQRALLLCRCVPTSD